MAKKDSPSCDPGWNDPPLFSYDSQTAQLRTSKPRTLLNKRVAFPLHEASPPTSFNFIPIDPTAPLSTCNISTLPPPPSVSVMTTKENLMKDKENTEDVVYNPSQTLETVMMNLCDVLNVKLENEEKGKTAEIQRRLDTMKKMWVDEKMCKDVQLKLLELSEALKKDETEKADYLQKSLMVDYAPSCSPWMSGVRHLIHYKESQPINQNEED